MFQCVISGQVGGHSVQQNHRSPVHTPDHHFGGHGRVQMPHGAIAVIGQAGRKLQRLQQIRRPCVLQFFTGHHLYRSRSFQIGGFASQGCDQYRIKIVFPRFLGQRCCRHSHAQGSRHQSCQCPARPASRPLFAQLHFDQLLQKKYL